MLRGLSFIENHVSKNRIHTYLHTSTSMSILIQTKNVLTGVLFDNIRTVSYLTVVTTNAFAEIVGKFVKVKAGFKLNRVL